MSEPTKKQFVVVNLFSVELRRRARPFFCSFVNLSNRKKKNLQQRSFS